MDAQSCTFWSATAALENIIKHSMTSVLREKFKYLPVLTRVLAKLDSRSKIEKVLNLIQGLTYGIKLTWDEPYVGQLIEELMKSLFSDQVKAPLIL